MIVTTVALRLPLLRPPAACVTARLAWFTLAWTGRAVDPASLDLFVEPVRIRW